MNDVPVQAELAQDTGPCPQASALSTLPLGPCPLPTLGPQPLPYLPTRACPRGSWYHRRLLLSKGTKVSP